MIFTSYCDVEPLASELAKERRSMSIDDQVEIEDALQRWGLLGPEDAHIYYPATHGRYQVLARRVPYANRFLVGVQDLNNNEIVVVAMTDKPIQAAVRPALRYLGPGYAPPSGPNPNWIG